MRKIIISIFIAISLLYMVQNVYCLSCEHAGRAGCILSCKAQNCATGYCNAANICICTRCNNGPWG